MEPEIDASVASDQGEMGAQDPSPSDQSPAGQQAQPAQAQQPAQEPTNPEPFPWEQMGQGQPQPAPWEMGQQQAAPWQQGPQQGYGQQSATPQIDARLLNPDVVKAQEQTIHAQYNAQFQAAQTTAEQAAIRREYEAAVREYRVQVKEATLAAREWQSQQQMMAAQQQALPLARKAVAERIAAHYKLPVEKVLKDDITGQEIWDPQAMARQAAFLAKYGTQQRQAERAASGVDGGYRPAGGPAAADDVSAMSDADFKKFREQNRRSNGALLRRVS